MGISKTSLFTEAQNELGALAKALAHPARIAIIEHLMYTDQCVCGDLVSELPLAQATVSQHLKELKNAGLIKGSISGKSICYCLDKKRWKALGEYISNIIDHCNPDSDCC